MSFTFLLSLFLSFLLLKKESNKKEINRKYTKVGNRIWLAQPKRIQKTRLGISYLIQPWLHNGLLIRSVSNGSKKRTRQEYVEPFVRNRS